MTDFCKLEIFIPESHLDILRDTLIACDAGHIGNYDACIACSHVISSWRPLQNSHPYSGKIGTISHEHEIKVEVTCTVENLDTIIAAVKAVHPYRMTSRKPLALAMGMNA